MKTAEQRINNIIGQLEGAKRMMNQPDNDCFALIVQLKAIKSAMASLMEKVIGEEFNRCIVHKKSQETDKMEKIIKEIINN